MLQPPEGDKVVIPFIYFTHKGDIRTTDLQEPNGTR